MSCRACGQFLFCAFGRKWLLKEYCLQQCLWIVLFSFNVPMSWSFSCSQLFFSCLQASVFKQHILMLSKAAELIV